MAPRTYTTHVFSVNVQALHDRVERRRPKPKNKRSSAGYQKLIDRYNKETVKRNYTDATKDNLQDIIEKFSRFCAYLPSCPQWRTVIKDCSKGITIAFLVHICEVDRVKKRSTMHQYLLRFKMLFNRENGRHMDTNDAKEVLAYVYGPLSRGFELDITVREKPVLGIDDLFLLLNYHWARDTSTFPTERHRAQFALILLLFFATGCRPAELVDATKKRQRRTGLDNNAIGAEDVSDEGFDYADADPDSDFGFEDDHDSAVADLGSMNDAEESARDAISMNGVDPELRKFDALCYEDVRLLKMRNPVVGERDVLAMEVKLAHHKGAKRRPKPTIFFFTEVDNPILCPITHLIVLAVADKAFEAPSLTTVERVFEHKVRGPVACTPLNWKPAMLRTPIFRRAERSVDGGVTTSPTLPLTYSQLRDCLIRLGLAVGLLLILTCYCFRRGTANVVDREATDAVRDQVMRHNPNSAVYNGAYINERVNFDVQSAVLERPSADGILRMLTHMSLTRDPRAPVSVPGDVLAALPPDPHIVELERRREELKAGVYRIQGTEIEAEVRCLTAEIGIARIRRQKLISEEYRADYFSRRPTEDIERQNAGQQEEEYVEQVVEHQLPERTQVAEVLCGHVADLNPQEIIDRRIRAAAVMLELCQCREVPRRYRLPVAVPPRPFVKKESPNLDELEPFPLVLAKTQCPICIGDESKKYEERMGSFCRPAKMMDHVEEIHLKERDPEARIECYHPTCKSQGLVLNDIPHFKNHVEKVHGVALRKPKILPLKK